MIRSHNPKRSSRLLPFHRHSLAEHPAQSAYYRQPPESVAKSRTEQNAQDYRAKRELLKRSPRAQSGQRSETRRTNELRHTPENPQGCRHQRSRRRPQSQRSSIEGLEHRWHWELTDLLVLHQIGKGLQRVRRRTTVCNHSLDPVPHSTT